MGLTVFLGALLFSSIILNMYQKNLVDRLAAQKQEELNVGEHWQRLYHQRTTEYVELETQYSTLQRQQQKPPTQPQVSKKAAKKKNKQEAQEDPHYLHLDI